MTCADETGRSRLAQHPGHPGQPAGRWSASGAVNRCWYQPGDVIPAPYPDADASRECVHGTQASAALRLGSAAQQRGVLRGRRQRPGQRGSVPGAADHRDRAGGFLQRRPQHLPHVRLTAPLDRAVASGTGPQFGHGLGERGERAFRFGPSARASTTSSHQRSGSSYPAAAASCPIGSAACSARSERACTRLAPSFSGQPRLRRRCRLVARPGVRAVGRRWFRSCSGSCAVPSWCSARASTIPAGRSQNRTGTPLRGCPSERLPLGREHRRTARTPTLAAPRARRRAAPPAAPCPARPPARAAGRRRPAPRSGRPRASAGQARPPPTAPSPARGAGCRAPRPGHCGGTRHPATSRQAR